MSHAPSSASPAPLGRRVCEGETTRQVDPAQTSEDTLNPRSGVVHAVIDTPTRSTPVRASTHSVNAEAPLCRARRADDPPERHRLGVGVLDGRERAPRFIVAARRSDEYASRDHDRYRLVLHAARTAGPVTTGRQRLIKVGVPVDCSVRRIVLLVVVPPGASGVLPAARAIAPQARSHGSVAGKFPGLWQSCGSHNLTPHPHQASRGRPRRRPRRRRRPPAPKNGHDCG